MTKQRRIPEVLTPAQAEAILAVPNVALDSGLRARAMMETMLRAGLRVSEVVNLLPEDVQLDERQTLCINNSKRGKSRRVPIDPRLAPWLERWAERRPAGGAFFCHLYGGKISEPNAVSIWRITKHAARDAAARCPELGIDPKKVWNHVLRHTAATEFYRSGRDLPVLARFLGHSSTSTSEIYVHITEDDVRDVIQKMAAQA